MTGGHTAHTPLSTQQGKTTHFNGDSTQQGVTDHLCAPTEEVFSPTEVGEAMLATDGVEENGGEVSRKGGMGPALSAARCRPDGPYVRSASR